MKNQEVTVDVLKRHLIDAERIPEDRIAVATGDQRELDGIDLFDPNCCIEHVITVEALKEGWDCSFAYAFCSVSRIASAVDVEQLLGRVLRMPYARRRRADALNRAYAFLSEPTFGAAARALVDKLVKMGFEEEEASESIEPIQRELDVDESVFGPLDRAQPTFRHIVTATPETIAVLRAREGVAVRETGDGKAEIAVAGQVNAELAATIADALRGADRTGFVEAVAGYREEIRKRLSPAERGETFAIPRLMSEIQGSLAFADTDVFMEHHEWSLLDHSAKLEGRDFAIRETARSYEIDLNGVRIAYRFAGEDEQLMLDVEVEGWTPQALVLWLDRQVRQPDIRQSQLLRWLSSLVDYLIASRGMHVTALMRCKFILARKVREMLAAIRLRERRGAYQRYLFRPEAKVDVSFDQAFKFRDGMYAGERRYRGYWKPNRHFLGADWVPAFDGAEGGEEMQCAQAIDSLPGVSTWLRNVARHPASFWLPTAGGRFFPDFVARMEDGRLLVVEYKGAHIAHGPDTAEKRTIGELWERKSNGTGLFVLAEKSVEGKDARVQLLETIAH